MKETVHIASIETYKMFGKHFAETNRRGMAPLDDGQNQPSDIFLTKSLLESGTGKPKNQTAKD